MRLLVNLVLATALVPVTGIYAQRVATMKPMTVSQAAAMRTTVEAVKSGKLPIEPSRLPEVLAAFRSAPALAEPRSSSKEAFAALSKILEKNGARNVSALRPTFERDFKGAGTFAAESSKVIARTLANNASQSMESLEAILDPNKNCDLETAAIKAGGNSQSAEDSKNMFQTKENIEQTALELYSVGQEGALAEVLELFTGLSANEDSQLRQSVSGLSSKLAETVQAQVALFMKDGVISKAELDILNKCGVFKSVVALSREAGNTEAASVEAALGVSTHCIASDGLTEASSPAAQREFVQACSAI